MAIEKMGKKIVDVKVKEEIKNGLGMDDPTTAKCVKILFTTLLQYTKGEAKAKVTKLWYGRRVGILQVHREPRKEHHYDSDNAAADEGDEFRYS